VAPKEIVPAMVEACHVITGEGADYDALLELIGNRRFVLIGEASHGTHDFYQERAHITRRVRPRQRQ
jgi:erythromycin esterase-like protein